MKLKLAELRREGDGLLDRGEPVAALRAYIAVLERFPKDYGARLALADALARSGAKAEAVDVYQAAARLCIDGGLPFAAIVAIRAIEALGEPAEELSEELVRVYARGSERVGPVGARINATYPPDLTVKAKELRKEVTVAQLVAEAARVGSDLSEIGELPPRFPVPALLGQLGPERLRAVLSTVWVHRLPAGHVLIRRGEIGTSCYLVAAGRLRVRAPDDAGEERELAMLGAGAIVGEMALISGAPRLATVEVVEPADVLELGPEALAAIGDELDQLAPVLDQLAQNRWLKNLLEQSPFFRVFAVEQRKQLLGRCSAYQVPPGATLFERGGAVKGVYLLLRGEVELDPSTDGSKTNALKLSAGAMLGVRPTLRATVAAATARTTSPATLLFLSAGSVQKLVQAVPELGRQLDGVVAARDAQLGDPLATR